MVSHNHNIIHHHHDYEENITIVPIYCPTPTPECLMHLNLVYTKLINHIVTN